ncbi:hypothetical protein [Parapedobacter koreensis]|uniref:Uncharacterized protein n=1 Tax=Parapedobacter koreensis TaxID=332977 RepID=A0A1H7UNM9_9SPHI|nr:hypothetical protein [Parapedobacter koreensis]SEL98563.1 hypothetical protein SAMN05421740_1202 [Parapedobacter koreensis]
MKIHVRTSQVVILLVFFVAFFSTQIGITFAQVRNDAESNLPAEGSIPESSWGTYLLGNNVTTERNLRFGVSNDLYTKAEIQLWNNNTSQGHIYFKTTNSSVSPAVERMIIRSNGNVGIGTTTPQAKLAVNGNILAKEVKVKTDIAVPDYVFDPEYELPSLADVEAYVKEHKHLPEIPSANDIEKDGLDLAEMNLLLLKKVEELTLYLMEERRERTVLEKRMDALKERVNDFIEISENPQFLH